MPLWARLAHAEPRSTASLWFAVGVGLTGRREPTLCTGERQSPGNREDERGDMQHREAGCRAERIREDDESDDDCHRVAGPVITAITGTAGPICRLR